MKYLDRNYGRLLPQEAEDTIDDKFSDIKPRTLEGYTSEMIQNIRTASRALSETVPEHGARSLTRAEQKAIDYCISEGFFDMKRLEKSDDMYQMKVARDALKRLAKEGPKSITHEEDNAIGYCISRGIISTADQRYADDIYHKRYGSRLVNKIIPEVGIKRLDDEQATVLETCQGRGLLKAEAVSAAQREYVRRLRARGLRIFRRMSEESRDIPDPDERDVISEGIAEGAVSSFALSKIREKNRLQRELDARETGQSALDRLAETGWDGLDSKEAIALERCVVNGALTETDVELAELQYMINSTGKEVDKATDNSYWRKWNSIRAAIYKNSLKKN